jgi:hypothetical protein
MAAPHAPRGDGLFAWSGIGEFRRQATLWQSLETRRMWQVALFHRLDRASNLNSHDENAGVEGLPARLGQGSGGPRQTVRHIRYNPPP